MILLREGKQPCIVLCHSRTGIFTSKWEGKIMWPDIEQSLQGVCRRKFKVRRKKKAVRLSVSCVRALRKAEGCLIQIGISRQTCREFFLIKKNMRPDGWVIVVIQSLSPVWLFKPMDCGTPGFSVLLCLPELAQIHVHQVGDAIQPSCPLLSFSPPAFNIF